MVPNCGPLCLMVGTEFSDYFRRVRRLVDCRKTDFLLSSLFISFLIFCTLTVSFNRAHSFVISWFVSYSWSFSVVAILAPVWCPMNVQHFLRHVHSYGQVMLASNGIKRCDCRGRSSYSKLRFTISITFGLTRSYVPCNILPFLLLPC